MPTDTDARTPEFKDLVERALQREVAARRELRPHAQLAISRDAPLAAVDEAYERLRARYDATAFAEYGPVAVEAAQTISDLLRVAYEAMRNPEQGGKTQAQPLSALSAARADETCRALEALRGAIERRLAEARAHRAAGRAQDALRMFESVIVLDRQNATAQEAVRDLRAQLEPKRPTTWSRLFGRLFARRVEGTTARALGG